jgi:predicted lysophospholipase L1 biosynthesis ABC-type transport system permease subunit
MHEGAPADVRQALADRGLTVLTTLDEERRVLDQSAYALALRLYGVVAALVLLMALAGLFVSTAVQLPARRRDAAALRVVGVPRASVMSAVAREFLVVLGGAAAAGIVAGTLAQWVVLRTITLGYIEDLSTPHLVAAISPLRLALLAAVAVVVLGAAAFVSASLTVRGARGSTLRESAR